MACGFLALVAGMVWPTAQAEPAAEDSDWVCDGESLCICEPMLVPVKVDEFFDQSCFKTIEAFVGVACPGCCIAVECSAKPADCEFRDVTVDVTTAAECELRTVIGGLPEQPVTISDLTTFHLEVDKMKCWSEKKDAFKIQTRIGGNWETVYKLSFMCEACEVQLGEPDE